jgi:C2 domain/EF-hand domain pair
MSRLDHLKKIFSEIDSNNDQQLSFDEIFQYLSKKSGKPFSRELLTEIFRTIDRDQKSLIKAEEFMNGYSKAENLILAQISNIKTQISEISDKSTKAQRSLVEARARNMQNAPENNLYIVVKKAEGLKAGGVTGNKAPIVSISCENNQEQTNPVPNPTNPEWNQSFTFPISVGSGDILIEVYDTDRGKKTNLLGEVAIPLRALSNQQLHEDFLELKGKTNLDKVQGKILIALQWIHDLPVYLEGLIKEYEESLKNDKEELETLENFLKELLAPIKNTQLPSWIKNNETIKNAEKKVSQNVGEAFDRTLGGKVKWPMMLKISVYLFLLLSAISTFLRNDFFNVINNQLTLSIGSLLVSRPNSDLPLNYRILTVGIFISEFYDIFWFWIYLRVISN